MIDAISRSALVNDMKGVVFREKPFGDADVDSLYQSIKNLYSGMIYLAEAAPALDVVPVVHARWIRDDLMNARCSNCHTRLPFRHCYDEEDGYEWDDEIEETPWCMHCGAKMDGEADA